MLRNVSVKVLMAIIAVVSLAAVAGGFGWLVFAAGQDGATQTQVLIALAVVLGVFVLVVVPCILATTAKVLRPVREIEERVDKIVAGDYSVCFACEGGDELVSMRISLDTLLGRLKHEIGFAQGVLKGIDTPFVVVDTKEDLVRTNPALLHILQQGGKPEDYYGQNVAYFFYGDASRRTVLRDCLEHHTTTSKEVELTGRKGGVRKIFINASPLFNLDGALMGALCIYQDLTELRAREHEILAKNATIGKAVQESEGISLDVARLAKGIATQVSEAGKEAERQTGRAMDTATAMEQMNVAVLEVARSAATAAEQASEARNMAEKGADVVKDAMAAIGEVTRLSEELKGSMAELGEQAEGIGKVLNVITDIADQTNLLALNAAIEAARAGDAGRGFAVVADEVRKLAEKTMTATKEVGDAIRAIQEGARKNVSSVDAAAKAVERSRTLSAASGDALQAIVSLVSDSSDQVRSIATAAEEQSATSDHINRSVDEVKEISQRTSQELTTASHGVRELAGKADALRGIIHSIGS